nr:aminotransferase class I/II-fold pyridoxal phosphate-dependent enzyme [uncultured Flavobacterium sp.]
MKVHQFPNRVIEINQETFLYFGGTAYLGLPTLPEFQEIIFKNIKIWGTAYGSSRNANIQLSAYETGETFLANFIQADAALTVSSGMLAGKLTLDFLSTSTDVFFHFPNAHPAIQRKDSIPLLLENDLNPRILDHKKEKITIVTDAVPSFQTQAISLKILDNIPSHKEITLVVDESHSIGILGKNGSGIYSSSTNPNIKRKILVASLGKALGLTGGVIASDSRFIQEIKNYDTFVAAAGMNPAYVQTLAESAHLVQQQRQKLQDNLNYLAQHVQHNPKINFTANYPSIYLDWNKSYDIVLQNKIVITHFDYPSDQKTLNRIVISSNHHKEDLDQLAQVLNSFI